MERKIIDISKWQGAFDFEKYKDGFDGVIMRCNNYNSATGKYTGVDEQFERSVSECERLGIPWGVYCFSNAVNDAEARAEAELTVKLIGNRKPSYPVFLDCEDRSLIGHCASNYKIWKQVITNAGFMDGIYGSRNWFNGELIEPAKIASAIWIAAYGSNSGKPEMNYKPNIKCDIWQYTSMGYFGSTRCDLNVCYRDFPAEINRKNDIEPAPINPNGNNQDKTPEIIPNGNEVDFIIERGDNGVAFAKDQQKYACRWVKYASGAMTATIRFAYNGGVEQDYGKAVMLKNGQHLNFPYAQDKSMPRFIDIPDVQKSVIAGNNLPEIAIYNETQDGMDFFVYAPKNDIPRFTLCVRLEGRWK